MVLNNLRISWVSWDKICLPKKKGGLGVKNVELFNLSLLAKWRWHFCMDLSVVWHDLLMFRYGSLMGGGGVDQSCPQNASRWMRLVFCRSQQRGFEFVA